MNIQEIYKKMHGNYDSIVNRLHDDERIQKYLIKFGNSHMDTTINLVRR